MKFDIIIGNPPYQEVDESGNNAGHGKNLFSKFIKLANELVRDNQYILLITPPTWMSPSKDIFDTVFNPNSILYLNIGIAKKYFPNIGSQFSWFLLQKTTEHHDTTVECEYNGLYYSSEMDLDNFPFLPVLLCAEVEGISNKVLFTGKPKLAFFRDQKSHPYSAKMKDELQEEKDESHIFPMYYNPRRILWSSVELTQQFVEKVIVSFSGYIEPMYDNGKYGVSHMVFSMPVNSQAEGEYIIRLLNSKVFQFIVSIYKWNGWNNLNVINLLPYPKNLTKNFTDKDLYEHFNLTQAEIDLIESVVGNDDE